MRGEPNTKVLLTIFRKDENRTFPVTITREEIRTQSVRGKVIEPGYGWIRLSQFQERTVDDFVKKVEEIYKQDPNLKGLVLDLRNDPGGLLDAAVAISAAFLPENVTVVSTNGQLAESKFVYKAAPEFYQRRAGTDPLRSLPAALKIGAAGGAGQRRLGLGQRNRGRRAAGPQARHHHGQPDLRQGLGADRAPARPGHRPEDHDGALLHAERHVDPGQGHRARRAGRRERRRQPVFAALRTREADLDKHLASGQGAEVKDPEREKARDEARKKARGRSARSRRRTARCPSSAPTRTSRWCRPSTS